MLHKQAVTPHLSPSASRVVPTLSPSGRASCLCLLKSKAEDELKLLLGKKVRLPGCRGHSQGSGRPLAALQEGLATLLNRGFTLRSPRPPSACPQTHTVHPNSSQEVRWVGLGRSSVNAGACFIFCPSVVEFLGGCPLRQAFCRAVQARWPAGC